MRPVRTQKQMVLSAKLLEFNVRFFIFKKYVNLHKLRLKITDELLEKMDLLWEKWLIDYDDYISPGTHKISDIDNSYDSCFEFLANLRKRFKSDKTIVFKGSDAEHLELNMNTKSTGKTPVTGFAPSVACIFQSERLIKLFAFDPKHPNKKKKPIGAYSFSIQVAYINEGDEPPADKDYKRLPNEKKSIFEIIIAAEKSKKLMYVKVCYVSPTGEEGKLSQPIIIKLY